MDRRRSERAFRRVWAGTAAANLADGVLLAAAPLLAATLTRDPVLVSGLVVAQTLPWLLLTLPAGVLVDRADRRRLLVVANGVRAAAVGLLALAVGTGTAGVPALYVAVLAVGAAETVVDNASLAVLPSLVERDRLDRANGRIFATQAVLGELVGPPVGAALFALAATAALVTGSVAFAVAAGAMALLPRRRRRADDTADPSTADPSPGARAQLVEGLRWFWSAPLLRTVAVMAGIVNLVAAATGGVLVLLATSSLGLTSAQFGLLLAAGAAGGVAAGLVAERAVRLLGPGPVVLLSNLLPALACAVLALTSDPRLAGAALALDSFAGTVGSVVVTTLRQSAVPEDLLGRVTSAYRLIALGALPVGGLLGGLVASAYGLRAPFVLGAVVLALMAAVLAPVLTTRRLEAAAAPPETAVS